MSSNVEPAGSAPRLAAFYRALSEMGQAMVHVSDPAALYDTLCRIATTWCGASMAWIGLVEGETVRPVAWGGPAREYAQGLDIRCAPAGDCHDGLGPTAYALCTGRPYICNDFHAEPRTAPFRERASRFGVRSSGAFPIVRASKVVGTLNLYFDTKDAFDGALVELIDQLVLDLCFALEHIDRALARARAEVEAKENELQLASIVETAMDAIITVDSRLNVVLFNGAASRMFGVTPQEAIGKPVDRFVPPEVRAGHRDHMMRYANQGITTRRMGSARELMGVRANGERFPMEASISRTGTGDRLVMTVMARDVTQLRLAEKAQLARTAAEAANQAKTEFLSRMSHELRTPLNAMLGFAQLLRSEAAGVLPARQREQLELVLQAGAHLRLLIDEMLDISRIEAGRLRVEHRDFELCELLDGVLRLSEPQAAEFGVTLHPGYEHNCRVLLRTDPDRLRQALLNLVSNAIKYNRPGGWVRIEVERDTYFVHILVRDNGLGMSEAQKTQLFQPFNRLGREQSGVEGTGIGLVLVRQLAGLLGGEITVESAEGKGTLARLTLPATDGRPMAETRLPGAEPAAPPAAGLVLYIEDNPINVILVEQVMSRWPKTQLVTASDGTSGLDLARTLHPDLVLLDMHLPDMHGTEVLHKLKSDEGTRDIPVVALSAAAVAEDVAAACAAGAADYWTKPIDLDAFTAGMCRMLAPSGPPHNDDTDGNA